LIPLKEVQLESFYNFDKNMFNCKFQECTTVNEEQCSEVVEEQCATQQEEECTTVDEEVINTN
jgi:hypothetical protein